MWRSLLVLALGCGVDQPTEVGVGEFENCIIQLLVSFCFDGFKACPQDCMIRSIKQCFYFWPLGQEGFSQGVPQSSQCPKLRLKRQPKFSVDLIEETSVTDFLEPLRELFWIHVPAFYPTHTKKL